VLYPIPEEGQLGEASLERLSAGRPDARWTLTTPSVDIGVCGTRLPIVLPRAPSMTGLPTSFGRRQPKARSPFFWLEWRWVGWSAFAIAVVLAALPPAKVNNSPSLLFEDDSVESQTLSRLEQSFGANEITIVQVRSLQPMPLAGALMKLESILAASTIVSQVLSAPRLESSAFEMLTDQEMGGPEVLPSLAERWEGPIFRALPLFRPGQRLGTSIALGRMGTVEERKALLEKLNQFRMEIQAEDGDVVILGSPFLNLELDKTAQDIERHSLPLLVGVTLLTGLIALRRLSLVAALFFPVGLTVFASDGMVYALGFSSNIIVNMVKPLLFAILLATGIHIAIAFDEQQRQGRKAALAARLAITRKALASALALITTCIGFASLLIAPLAPIRQFGSVAALAILLGMLLLLFFFPWLLRRMPNRNPQRNGRTKSGEWSVSLMHWGQRHRRSMIVVSILCFLGGIFAMQRLKTNVHAPDYFPESHPLRVAERALEASGLSISTADVLIERNQSLLENGGLLSLSNLSNELEQLPGVHSVIGVPILARQAFYRANLRDALPDPFFLSEALASKADVLGPYLSQDAKTTRITLLIQNLDPEELARLRDSVEDLGRKAFPGESIQTALTGTYPFLIHAQASLLETLRSSLLTSALLMTLVLMLVFRSARIGLLAIVPNLVPIFFNFIVMYAFNIPVDIGTSMTFAITIGLAVDNTFHMLTAFRSQNINKQATQTTGKAVLLGSLIVGMGFLSLATSDFAPTRNFGILTAVAMLTALLGDLLILPALLPKEIRLQSSEPEP
jgi:uncharacterized protein